MQAHPLSSRAASHSFPFPPEPSELAHDAGNLLSALGLYCDLLECPGVLKAEHRHYAAELRVIADRSTRLLSRLRHSGFELSPSRTGELLDWNFVRLCIEICAPNTIGIDIDDDLPSLPVSEEVIERIVLNLVRNAAEALQRQSNPHGHIEVILRVKDNELHLVVEDNGPGMTPSMAAQFVSPQGPAPSGNRGLGHRILHELTVSTGAAFALYVHQGKGCRFSFRWKLPQTINAASAPTGGASSLQILTGANEERRPTC